MRKLAMVVGAIALTGAAEPPQKFDLVCNGAAVVDDSNGAFERSDVHLRIDLAAGKWCDGECKVIRDVAEVQPAAIWFVKETAEEAARGLSNWRAVSRETGIYHHVKDIQHVGKMALISKCEPAPFSGFPKIETKF